jgi:UDP-N-acetylglucosamine 1-carboxyvinyltransferase
MGADISGIGSNLIKVNGVKSLSGCTHKILPDMIEIGSFIGLAAVTMADLTIKNVHVEQLYPILETFRRLGVQLDIVNDDIIIHPQEHYEIEKDLNGSIPTIADAVWPGFPADLLSVMLVVATQAKGTVLIHQKMFESRLFFVDKLIEMGAQLVLCDPHRASVIGLDRAYPLRGIQMTSPDIRAGIALLIAALSAEGISIIENIDQIDRGYEMIDTRLSALGAAIERIT